MRICDRCGNKAVADTFKSHRLDTEVDLCPQCQEAFSNWLQNAGGPECREDPEAITALNAVKRRRGRPPKTESEE